MLQNFAFCFFFPNMKKNAADQKEVRHVDRDVLIHPLSQLSVTLRHVTHSVTAECDPTVYSTLTTCNNLLIADEK